MNFPPDNLRALKYLADMASPNWDNVPSAKAAGKQGIKMKAALEMVLAFHSGDPWSSARELEWYNLQTAAGVDWPHPEATTKVLCDTIRAVLGTTPQEA